MTLNALSHYQDTLYGCRFCPMCKPANEVANLTQYESHTTRARAMLLWRILNGMTQWTPRGVELLYESTLDSISEAWCVSHYAVSDYVLAARAEVYAAGLAPKVVRDALDIPTAAPQPVKAATLLLAGEFAELGSAERLPAGLAALKATGVAAETVVIPSGALAYSLGAHDQAKQQAQAVSDFIRTSGAQTIIADGPQTLWALHKIYSALGITLPAGLTITSLAEYLAGALTMGQLSVPEHGDKKTFLHDSRSAALLADSLAKAETIQPGYRGDEANLGAGVVYDAPRKLTDAMQMQRVYSVWQRSLSKSSGADDGLWLTYPKLAAGLARQRLDAAQQSGAQVVITDSPLSAAHLGHFAGEYNLAVYWLPELIIGDGQ